MFVQRSEDSVLHHHSERNQAVRLQANVLFVLVVIEQMRRAVWGHERHITVWPDENVLRCLLVDFSLPLVCEHMLLVK
ncbi:hypothetical protein QQF64_003413 [Cirrhinus molitorella]|uniref:Uncharacterized protein n=1 Tax=Cirrhinus molitorella TaxID=172907 RepID=A0ABR3ML94_9TELE